MNKKLTSLFLLLAFLSLEAAGCIVLIKFARWEIVLAVQAILWGRHLLIWLIAKRKRESIPPTIWDHIYQ